MQHEPGTYFKPNSQAQASFLMSQAPEVLISSAYGKGKSRVICQKAWWLCLAFPGVEVVLARKTRASMGATTLRTLLEEVVHSSYITRGWKPTADGGSTLFAPNGSKLLIIGLDNPGRARSGSFTAAYVDQAEELDEVEWNAIGGRLRHPLGPYRQLGAACNPEAPDHFLFRKFRPDLGSHKVFSEFEEVLPDGEIVPKGRLLNECIISGVKDNYENLPLDYRLRLSRYKGRYFARYVQGQWVAFEGQVYDQWNPDIHLMDRPKEWERWGGNPPPDWPRYRGIDFGYRNPFVCQWWTRDPDGVWILYREMYHTARTVLTHGKQMKGCEAAELAAVQAGQKLENERRAAARLDPKPIKESLSMNLSVADHDAEDVATLQDECLIWSNPAEKDVTPGIQCVYEAMVPFEVEGHFRAKLRILRDALVEKDDALVGANLPTCTAEEVAAYRYEQYKVATDKSPKETPRKMNDHGLDCMRYVLYSMKVQGDPNLIFL